ncbi:MAG: sialidase family protein [bacterium]
MGFVNPGRVVVTDDTGRTWKVAYDSIKIQGADIPQFAKGNREGELYCCANTDISYNFSYSVLHSLDYGKSWKVIKSPSSLWSIIVDKKIKEHCLVGTFLSYQHPIELTPVYESFDAGQNWTQVGKLPTSTVWNLALTIDGKKLFAATSEGLYKYQYSMK